MHSRNSLPVRGTQTGHTTNYSSNNLNQYTARTNHGYLLVEGTSTNATVKVYETDATEVTATRNNNYYFRDWDPDTTSTASDYPEINIKEGTRVSDTKRYWIPAVSESSITYGANGNLTADALWTYTYDEENRLITMEETSSAATAGFPDTTITFKYDYLGRRVEKKVVRGTTTESHLRFVWRGWLWAHSSPKSSTALRNVGTVTGIVRCAALQGADPASPALPLETRSSTRPSFARYEFCEISGPVAELNAASDNARVKTYTWGPDISGSFGGAGGNGGVLIFQDHTSTVNESFYPAYDAQGNVTGLIDTAGNLDAAYEYDPFGKLIRHAGTRKDSMSLLYGTKYTDMETGLIYFGYRYYDPRQGRFINRDPIEEKGGLNLYGFVGNSPTDAIDYLGLCGSPPRRPRLSDFDHRVDDERDRYDKAKERWDDDYDDWRDCIRDKWIREAEAITTQPNPTENLISAFDFLELLRKAQRNNGAPGDLAQNEHNGRSVLGDALRKVPYFGGLLGAIGDTISGVVNTAYGLGTFGISGTLGRGLSQLEGGISSIVEITFKDAYATVVGMGIGTLASVAQSVGDAFGNLISGNIRGFGINLAVMVADLPIPKYGWWNGLNWGEPQFGADSRPNPINQGDYAGYDHDQYLKDFLWIDRYQYSLTGHTPNGIFGGLYGILGTVPFTIFNRNPQED